MAKPVVLLKAAATPPAEVLDVKNYGAVGDGAHDDTSGINTGMAAALATSKTLFFPAGTYKTTAAIAPPSTVALLGVGASSKIYRADTGDVDNGAIIALSGKSGVSVSSLFLDSSLPAQTSVMRGFEMSRCSNITLYNIGWDHLNYGIKQDDYDPPIGTVTTGVTASYLYCTNTLNTGGVRMPIYLDHISNSSFSHLNLFASSYCTPGDHQIYLSSFCTDLTFAHMVLTGGAGFPIQLWMESNVHATGIERVTFTDITMTDVPYGIVVECGHPHATDITFDGILGRAASTWADEDYPWFFCDASNVNVLFKNFDLQKHYLLWVDESTEAVTLQNGTLTLCDSYKPSGIQVGTAPAPVLTNVTVT
jgi:hypothetical protein